MYPLKILVDLDRTMICQRLLASLHHSRLPALIGLDQTETQHVGSWQKAPYAGHEAPKDYWTTSFKLDDFTTAQTRQTRC
jgi:hypothetical protein